MPDRWPADTDSIVWELDVLDRDCASCGRMMHICDHRDRRFFTLEGPVKLVCKLNHGPDPDCPGHTKTKSPEMEASIALPAWAIGWDVFCWIGHRRSSRHWSIPQICHELVDSYDIKLTEPCIALSIQWDGNWDAPCLRSHETAKNHGGHQNARCTGDANY